MAEGMALFQGLGWEAWYTLTVIVGMVTALVREVARPDVIVLTALGSLLLPGIIAPAEAFTGFANPAVHTVGALFVIASGVQRTNALSAVMAWLTPVRASLPGVIFRVMGSTSVMSAFLNNTPIVAMLMPGLQRWAEEVGVPPSRIFIPLSYAAIVGGIVTLIGTSTNLVVSGMLVERGFEGFSFFELTWIGLPAALVVLLYFSVIGYRFLPDRKNGDLDAERQPASYQFDVRVTDSSGLIGQNVEEAGLRNLKRAFLTHIERNGHLIGPVGPEHVLQANDVLTFSGDAALIDTLIQRPGLDRAAPKIAGVDEEKETLPLFNAVVSQTSSLVGKTLKESGFRERFQGVVLAIQRKSEQLRGPIGDIPVKPGDLLLIEARPGFAQRWNANREEFYFVTARGREQPPNTRKAPLALGLVVAMIVIGGTGLLPIVTVAFATAIIMVLTGCLKAADVRQAVDIPVLLVIAGAFGIGQALDGTGLAESIARILVGGASAYGTIAVLIVLYIATNIVTELITNNAAAVLMLPIAVVAAVEIGIDPHAAAITVAVGASASFLTPIGYQTNLMVMGAGGYRFTDYFRAGLPVTCILLVITVAMVKFVWL